MRYDKCRCHVQSTETQKVEPWTAPGGQVMEIVRCTRCDKIRSAQRAPKEATE